MVHSLQGKLKHAAVGVEPHRRVSPTWAVAPIVLLCVNHAKTPTVFIGNRRHFVFIQ